MCPKSHPNAYLKGTHCCSSGFEKVAERDGDLCDGSAIGFTSKCCKNDGYAACPKGVCGNYKGDILVFFFREKGNNNSDITSITYQD